MVDLRPLSEPDTAELFAPLRADLLALLRGLELGDWDAPTIAGAWRVRDVVAHLLDGELRTLAAHRDGHALAAADTLHGYADVISLIQRLNAEGVASGQHLSARLLTDLLDITGAWMSEFITALDPDAPALFAVAWAGESHSNNRFDTAREYTERWHHQMQIRLAVGERGRPEVLLAERYAAPLLKTAARVLPHAYREVAAARDAAIVFAVHSHAARSPQSAVTEFGEPWSLGWTLRRDGDGWRLYDGEVAAPTARLTGSVDAWWRLLFNALSVDEAPRAFAMEGPGTLVAPLWRARAVMV